VDRAAGFGQTRWQIPLVAPVSPAEGGIFVCGDPAGANLRGRFVVPADTRLAGRGIGIGDSCFLVLTLQQGAAPAPAITGAGLDAVVTVGRRTVRFDGEKIVLGEKAE
jgi:hypothetical protein